MYERGLGLLVVYQDIMTYVYGDLYINKGVSTKHRLKKNTISLLG